jgi:hypothetical protein
MSDVYSELKASWAEIDRLRNILKSLEWNGQEVIDYDGITAKCCPWCFGLKPGEPTYNGNRVGHGDKCELEMALAPRTTPASPKDSGKAE